MAIINLGRKQPVALGIRGGKLAPCRPDDPSCVCSQYNADEPVGLSSHVVPLRYAGDPADAMTRLIAVLMQRADAKLVQQRRDYLHVEFARISWLGIVDDVEFLLEPDANGEGGAIHVRAGSRAPGADLGMNRSRVEDIRVAFDEAE